MNFQIFYQDGPAERNEIPEGRGVQVVLQDNDDHRVELVTGADYYVLRDGKWQGVDIFGLFDFLLDSKMVLFGRTITNEEYSRIVTSAMKTKTGWTCFERKPHD